MSFEVVPGDLAAAGGQVKDLSNAVPLMTTFLETHLHLNGDSKLFAQFKGEVDKVRTTLVADYPARAQPTFVAAGGALEEMAADYRQVDLAQAAAFDALLPDDHEQSGVNDMYAGGVTPGVDLSEFSALLADPASEFAVWEQFQAMRDAVKSVLGWDWLFDLLGLVGVPNLSQTVTEWLQGDYDSMGRCMAALKQVSEFWSLVRREMAASMIHVDSTWSGNAADAAFTWFSEYDEILAEHATNVNGVHSRVYGYAMGLRMVLDSLASLFQTLIEFVTGVSGFPNSWTDVLEWLTRGAGRMVLKKIFLIVDAILLLLDAAILVCGLLTMAFSQIAGHGEIALPDDTPALEPSDVDGP
ncbi:hypothetical protein FHP29_13015 [Nocardioides albidus]|uniref:Uncharacterized protein n=1 Tax=Nocardioides albidus TaxID=1517589 RepID=A0A5C4VV80_9ACTN|nr:hypothetical protein [Nocardioides albidus]TNM39773.1 hypothetical protein FHP29_13015 [Nocardioides albidus]